MRVIAFAQFAVISAGITRQIAAALNAVTLDEFTQVTATARIAHTLAVGMLQIALVLNVVCLDDVLEPSCWNH